MEKSEFKLGLGGLNKEWLKDAVDRLANTALKSQQNAIGFINQNDDDILKPAAKTSGYLSPSAYRASKNTPWDYEPPETFIPDYTPPKTCSHEWAKYVGLNEAFEYCKKCDEKKK